MDLILKTRTDQVVFRVDIFLGFLFTLSGASSFFCEILRLQLSNDTTETFRLENTFYRNIGVSFTAQCVICLSISDFPA